MKIVNTEYFVKALEKSGISQNRLADILGVNRAVLSRTLRGLRPARFNEAVEIATILRLPQDDVFAALGMKGASTLPRDATVPVIGELDDSNKVLAILPNERIECPYPDAVAAVRTVADSYQYGWIYYVGQAMQSASVRSQLCLISSEQGVYISPIRLDPVNNTVRMLNSGITLKPTSIQPIVGIRTNQLA